MKTKIGKYYFKESNKRAQLKRVIPILVAIVVMFPSIFLIPDNYIASSAKDITVYSQTDSRWGSHSYGKGPNGTSATISSGGCGILAYVNAINYLNGNFIEPTFLADWSVNNGYRINGQGTSMGLYSAFANAYGEKYGFVFSGSSTSYSGLIDHLKSGEVAIGSTPTHLMAIVDYDSSTNKFLILDSYKSSNRHTYSTGYTWETASSCQETPNNYLSFSTFCFLKNNSVSDVWKIESGWDLSGTFYPKDTVNNTPVYYLQGGIVPNRYISPGDDCYIDEVYVSENTGTKYVHVDYPIEGGKKRCTDFYARFDAFDIKPLSITAPKVSVAAKIYASGDTAKITWNSVSGATEYWLDVWRDGEHVDSRSVGNATSV